MGNNNKTDDQEKAIRETQKAAKQTADRVTKPIRQASGRAKQMASSYARQQMNVAAKNAAKAVGRAMKEAVKAIGKAVKSAFEAMGKAIASMGPWGWVILAIIVILVIAYGTAVYNSDKISAWIIGDSTASGAFFESTYYDDAITVRQRILDDQIEIGNDLPMLSKEDVIRILDHVIQYNSDMGFSVGIGVKYDEYAVDRHPFSLVTLEEQMASCGATLEDGSANPTYQDLAALKYKIGFTDPTISSGYYIRTFGGRSGVLRDVLSENMSYGQIATLDIEGTEAEKYYNGTYDIDWKLLLILCEMMAEANSSSFGSNGEWTAEDQQNLNSGDWFSTSMDGYFLTDEKIDALCKLFDYKIVCYPDDAGYDYVQMGKIYSEDEYNSSGVITNIRIRYISPSNLAPIDLTYNNDIEHAYETELVKKMTYTLYPVTKLDGSSAWILNGIIRYDNTDSGKWTYIAPYATGDVFDGDNYLKVDQAGNPAVRYETLTAGDGFVYGPLIINDEEMQRYRAVNGLRVPYIAPITMTNVFMKATYNYKKIDDTDLGRTAASIGADEGTLMLNNIEILVDGVNFYQQISQLIPGFSFEHFYELYGYYRCRESASDTPETLAVKANYNNKIDAEIERWKNIEELYKKGTDAVKLYEECHRNGTASPYPSKEVALKQGQVRVVLDRSKMGAPTYGLIFVGDYSQRRSSSGTEHLTGQSSVWIGESHGKRYYDFFDVNSYTRAGINRQDRFIEQDTSYEDLQKMCDELFHTFIITWGREKDNQLHIEDEYKYSINDYTARDGFNGTSGGWIWSHFCSCDGSHTNEELIKGLMQWQRDNPGYSVTAMLALVATRAYMEGDPWMIDMNKFTTDGTSAYLGTFVSYQVSYYMITHGVSKDMAIEGIADFWTNADEVLGFLEYLFSFETNYIDKGPTNFFEMEFGKGFANTQIDNNAYTAAEIKYTYGGKTEVYATPEMVGVNPPWWNDPLFPEENTGSVSTLHDNKGWCNVAGNVRATILQAAGYSCYGNGTWPLATELGDNAFITSPFGWRKMTNYQEHHGIDIYAAEGTPVLAVVSGSVIGIGRQDAADVSVGGGYMITIKADDDGTCYTYMHLTDGSAIVNIGDHVEPGDQLGLSGNTGVSTGAHLHFEIKPASGGYLDPAPFLGVDESSPYWKTHVTYRTKQECVEAVEVYHTYGDLH